MSYLLMSNTSFDFLRLQSEQLARKCHVTSGGGDVVGDVTGSSRIKVGRLVCRLSINSQKEDAQQD